VGEVTTKCSYSGISYVQWKDVGPYVFEQLRLTAGWSGNPDADPPSVIPYATRNTPNMNNVAIESSGDSHAYTSNWNLGIRIPSPPKYFIAYFRSVNGFTGGTVNIQRSVATCGP
jgi:hypothetical protein